MPPFYLKGPTLSTALGLFLYPLPVNQIYSQNQTMNPMAALTHR